MLFIAHSNQTESGFNDFRYEAHNREPRTRYRDKLPSDIENEVLSHGLFLKRRVKRNTESGMALKHSVT